MSTRRYTLPVEQTEWKVPSGCETTFVWEYDEGRDKMLGLYEKGKERQWNTNKRIDWTRSVDPDNPLGIPDELVPINGSPMWERLTPKERGYVRRHMVAWQFSQFLHGEQGALICTAKIVQTVPSVDAKFYAATQVMDEARHCETYSRYLHEKLDMAYPINPPLQTLLDQVVRDSRWDMTYLGMQILIEGLALAAFGTIRDTATEPTAQELNAYVMQDEARHVAFGRLALRDYYPQLGEKERDEREEFAVEACYHMRDRFMAEEVWRRLDFDADECVRYVYDSPLQKQFRSMLFSRIVPTLKAIGLWGKRIRTAFEDMQVIGFADSDPDELMAADERTAAQMEARRGAEIDEVVRLGRD